MVVGALGVVSGILGIFSVSSDLSKENDADYVYHFAAGLDGAGPADDRLDGAGGQLPRIIPFNEHGERICCGKRNGVCRTGNTRCRVFLEAEKENHQQPSYTLFKARKNDPICLAWITVEFPEKTTYGWIGNWGQECGAPWYYSDIHVQNNLGADKVSCIWLDSKGKFGLTGLQVHWPEYHDGYKGNGNDSQYYCHNPPALSFFKEPSPRNIYYWATNPKNISSKHEVSVYKSGYRRLTPEPCGLREHNGEKQPDDITKERDRVDQNMTKQSNDDGQDKKFAFRRSPQKPHLLPRMMVNETRLIKSRALSHRATDLCKSPYSVGPSFVSYQERKFCHMADKRLYSFCEGSKEGECWDDEKHEIIHKSASGVVRRAANPAVAFTDTLNWG